LPRKVKASKTAENPKNLQKKNYIRDGTLSFVQNRKVQKVLFGPKLIWAVFGLLPLSLFGQVPASKESLERTKLIEEQERLTNIAVFSILFFFMLGLVLFVMSRRRRKRLREPQIVEAKSKKLIPPQKKMPVSGEPSGNFNPTTKARQNLVITDETQTMITNLVTSIKVPDSQKKDMPSSEELKRQVDDLENSEVMQALAGTLVSAPKIDETPAGKFSKMSIEGDLIFEEEIEQKKIEAHFQIKKP
jgi:hypothetical protein